MKKAIATALTAAGLSALGVGSAHADAAFTTSTSISASCHGVFISARGYTYQAGTPGNDYVVAVYTNGVPSWSVGFFQTRTDASVPVPHDGQRHEVRVWVHAETSAPGDSTTLDKTTGRCQ